jgi:hypothetical protein
MNGNIETIVDVGRKLFRFNLGIPGKNGGLSGRPLWA